MASILKVNTLTGVTAAGTIAVTAEGGTVTTNLQQGLGKSWMNIDGTGTPAIRDSFNVASIADRGTGLYTQSLTSAMSSDDFAGTGSAQSVAADVDGRNRMVVSEPDDTTTVFVNSFDTGGSAADCGYTTSMIMGDLA